MSQGCKRLSRLETAEISAMIQDAGVAGAGGAGFPTYGKWEHLDDVSRLLVNHQESEPNYYIDKWLGKRYADEFATLFDVLLEEHFETIVVATKESYRETWMEEFESATDAAVYTPDDLPMDPDEASGVVFAYTDDRYEFGMESVLLRQVAGQVLKDDLPTDHGWIVQNSETLYNIYRALCNDNVVKDKYVHVDGNVSEHRFLKVPVGTPTSALLEAAGRSLDDIDDEEVLLDGGPGWCFEIDDAETFGVTKRTNCLLVIDRETVEESTFGDSRINLLKACDWSGPHETEPTTLTPEVVRIPLITNSALGHIVSLSDPIVEEGDTVSEGEKIAVPAEDGISTAEYASIGGTVTQVTDSYIEIQST